MKAAAIVVFLIITSTLWTDAYADVTGDNKRQSPVELANIPLTNGEAFVPARARLIKHGWKPVRVHRRDSDYIGPDTLAMSRTFPEVDSCSMDTASCIMYYKKSGNCLRVDTVGEIVSVMKVAAFSRECFSDQN